MHAITNYIESLRRALNYLPAPALEETIALLSYARAHGNRVFFMGNGGSGSTASHFATDLGKGTAAPGKPRFKVLPLNDSLPTVSAYSNDMGYETVFAEQLKAFIERGDIVIGLSTSGKSRNVLEAMKVARDAGGVCIGLTGFDGGDLKRLVDLNLHVPENHTPRVEDTHHIMMHLICECIKSQQSNEQYRLPSWAVAETWGIRVRRES
jgi:D-sedoheptulose 7-phosphate isomerase